MMQSCYLLILNTIVMHTSHIWVWYDCKLLATLVHSEPNLFTNTSLVGHPSHRYLCLKLTLLVSGDWQFAIIADCKFSPIIPNTEEWFLMHMGMHN